MLQWFRVAMLHISISRFLFSLLCSSFIFSWLQNFQITSDDCAKRIDFLSTAQMKKVNTCSDFKNFVFNLTVMTKETRPNFSCISISIYHIWRKYLYVFLFTSQNNRLLWSCVCAYRTRHDDAYIWYLMIGWALV